MKSGRDENSPRNAKLAGLERCVPEPRPFNDNFISRANLSKLANNDSRRATGSIVVLLSSGIVHFPLVKSVKVSAQAEFEGTVGLQL